MEERLLGQELRILSNMICRTLDNLISIKYGLTGMQGRIIGFIDHNSSGDVFQRDIENEFMIRRPTASQLLKLLEKKGLVLREPVDFDGRLKKLTLSPEANAVHEDLVREIDGVERRLRENLSEEDLKIFFSVVDTMKQNME